MVKSISTIINSGLLQLLFMVVLCYSTFHILYGPQHSSQRHYRQNCSNLLMLLCDNSSQNIFHYSTLPSNNSPAELPNIPPPVQSKLMKKSKAKCLAGVMSVCSVPKSIQECLRHSWSLAWKVPVALSQPTRRGIYAQAMWFTACDPLRGSWWWQRTGWEGSLTFSSKATTHQQIAETVKEKDCHATGL